jgi:hypothetical protein
MLPFEEVLAALGRSGRATSGVRLIRWTRSSARSTGRRGEFDREFRPGPARGRAGARRRGRGAAGDCRDRRLSPIGELHFVQDGHNRGPRWRARSATPRSTGARVEVRTKLGADRELRACATSPPPTTCPCVKAARARGVPRAPVACCGRPRRGAPDQAPGRVGASPLLATLHRGLGGFRASTTRDELHSCHGRRWAAGLVARRSYEPGGSPAPRRTRAFVRPLGNRDRSATCGRRDACACLLPPHSLSALAATEIVRARLLRCEVLPPAARRRRTTIGCHQSPQGAPLGAEADGRVRGKPSPYDLGSMGSVSRRLVAPP